MKLPLAYFLFVREICSLMALQTLLKLVPSLTLKQQFLNFLLSTLISNPSKKYHVVGLCCRQKTWMKTNLISKQQKKLFSFFGLNIPYLNVLLVCHLTFCFQVKWLFRTGVCVCGAQLVCVRIFTCVPLCLFFG